MDWDGKNRRKFSQAHDDSLNARADSTSILLELQSINQSLSREIAPLLRKHDECLFGTDGRNGIVGVVGFLQRMGYILLAITSGEVIITIVKMLKG